MNKTYEAPKAESIVFASQDALTASEIQAKAGFNWKGDWLNRG